jgi:pimeloyl-ACP methyl ester carboxylesterase
VCYSPIIILHGEPDFDHNYLLPDMDRLSDSFRLIYYDHRGRGQSGSNVQPEDVTIESEIKDLESLREYFQLVSVAVLGHSWGGVLAMEYAIRHPNRVSHLILMNTAPASHNDYMLLREQLPHKRAWRYRKAESNFILCHVCRGRSQNGCRILSNLFPGDCSSTGAAGTSDQEPALQDCGHFPFLESPEKVGKEIHNFLQLVL